MGSINYSSKKETSISPGPGTYNQEKLANKSYSYSMGAKVGLQTNKSTANLPAPNAYQPKYHFKYDGHTKFGSDRRRGMINERNSTAMPAPNAYEPFHHFSKTSPPKYSFSGKSA